MDLRDYLDILRARWKLIVATTLLGVLAAGLASMLTTPLYKATASVFVSASDGDATVANAYSGSLFTQQRVKSYVDVVTSTDVAQAVVNDLNVAMTPGEVASAISVNNPLDTVVLEISATDPSPQLAQQLADSATEQFKARVQEIEVPTASGKSLITISTIQPADLPTSPVSPRTTINLALGLLVGLAVGIGAAVLLETLDTRLKSVEALQKYFDIPLLGVIAFDPEAPKKPLIAHDQPHSKRAESFRQLRTNLQFVDVDHRPRSIVVTSSVPREGKTTSAINLAITLAQTGQPVFLIEGDLRRPKVTDYLGIEGAAGLTDVLVGRATVDEVLQPWGSTGNMWVLAAGPLPPNPSELLGSQSMADLLHHLESRATLIIDAPPLLPVTDAAVLTRLAGGAIVVTAANRTRREHLRTALTSIDNVGGRILGLVMNMAATKGPDAHRYGYAYGYDYKGNAGRPFDDHPPVVPAGLGGLPGVNGSSTPTMPPSTTTPTPPTATPPSASTPTPPTATPPSRTPSGPAKPGADAPAVPAPKPPADGAKPPVAPTPTPPVRDAGTPAAGQPAAAPAAAAVPEPTTSTVAAPLVRTAAVPPPPPAPAPREDPAVSPFDADTVLPGEPWQPPRPRPAFDPLTAPLDEVTREL